MERTDLERARYLLRKRRLSLAGAETEKVGNNTHLTEYRWTAPFSLTPLNGRMVYAPGAALKVLKLP